MTDEELRHTLKRHIEADETFQNEMRQTLQPLQRLRWWGAGVLAAVLAIGGVLAGGLYTLGPWAARRAVDDAISGNAQIENLRRIPAHLDELRKSMERYHAAPPKAPEPPTRRPRRRRPPR